MYMFTDTSIFIYLQRKFLKFLSDITGSICSRRMTALSSSLWLFRFLSFYPISAFFAGRAFLALNYASSSL